MENISTGMLHTASASVSVTSTLSRRLFVTQKDILAYLANTINVDKMV